MWLSLSIGASERPNERGSEAAHEPIGLTCILGYVIQPMGYRADSLGTATFSTQNELAFFPESREAVRQSGNTLLKWLKEFQSKESHFASGIVTEDFCGDGRGFAGDDS